MHVNGARATSVPVTPDIAEQNVARQDPTTMLQQILKEKKFLRGQLHLATIVRDGVAREVHRDRPERQRRRWGLSAFRTPNQRTNASDELVGAEWLGEIVVGADVQTDDTVGFFRPRRHHKYGDGFR